MKNKKIAFSIFVIAFSLGLNVAGIAPILGLLNHAYQSKGTSFVQMLQTVPYALLMLGSFFVGRLTMHISKKEIVVAGLCLIGVCGVIPFFMQGFWILLCARILIGFGFGIVSPMNTAIISEHFEKEERPAYMGLHVVGMGVGTMVTNMLGSFLSSYGFRFYFLVHGFAFVSAAIVLAFLFEKEKKHTAIEQNEKMNAKIYFICACSFFHTLFITFYSTNIGIYIMDDLHKKSTVTGIATALNAGAALMIGILFAQISKKLKQKTLATSIFCAAAGFFILILLPDLAGVFLASILCGASLSCFMAQASYLITIFVKEESVAKASGLFSIFGGIGGLISPLLGGGIASIMPTFTTSYIQFLVSLIGMVILGAIVSLRTL